MTDTIVCPRCNFEIEVADALSARLRERVCEQVDAEFREKHRVLADLEKSLQDRQKHLETSQAALEQELADRVTVECGAAGKGCGGQGFRENCVTADDARNRAHCYQEQVERDSRNGIAVRGVALAAGR